MTGETVGRAKFDDSVDDPVASLRVFQVKIQTFIHYFVKFLELFGVACIKAGADLTNNPDCNSNDKVCRDVFSEKVPHLGDYFLSELVRFLVVLHDESQEVVEDIWSQVLTS